MKITKELIEEFQKKYCGGCKSYFFCGGECMCVHFDNFIKEKEACQSSMTKK